MNNDCLEQSFDSFFVLQASCELWGVVTLRCLLWEKKGCTGLGSLLGLKEK